MLQEKFAADAERRVACLQAEADKEVPIVAPGEICLLQPRIPPRVSAITDWTRSWSFVEECSTPAGAGRSNDENVELVELNSGNQRLLH